jgi:hypothetical protein
MMMNSAPCLPTMPDGSFSITTKEQKVGKQEVEVVTPNQKYPIVIITVQACCCDPSEDKNEQ